MLSMSLSFVQSKPNKQTSSLRLQRMSISDLNLSLFYTDRQFARSTDRNIKV